MLTLFMIKNTQSRFKKLTSKKSIAIMIVLLLVIGGGLYWGLSSKNSNSAQERAIKASHEDINFDPPTKEEEKATEDHKTDLPDNTATPPAPATGKKEVKPVISNLEAATINAYVPGVFEDNGTCTATYSMGGQIKTQTTTGFKNASYTQCPPFNPSALNLAPGVWSVTVDYSSAAAQGTSEQATLKI
jgi:hypothetical protein